VIKITEKESYRRPLLTSRQVAMIAAFGGLGFAWRALGLVIPLYPPYVLDIRESINVIAAFAGGPWVAVGVGILIGLPSSVPFCDVIYYPLIGIILSLVSKHVFAKRDTLYGIYSLVIIAVVIAIAEAIALTIFNFEWIHSITTTRCLPKVSGRRPFLSSFHPKWRCDLPSHYGY